MRYSMRDRNTTLALLSAYQHMKRKEDAIRKAGRLYGIPEVILNYEVNKHMVAIPFYFLLACGQKGV